MSPGKRNTAVMTMPMQGPTTVGEAMHAHRHKSLKSYRQHKQLHGGSKCIGWNPATQIPVPQSSLPSASQGPLNANAQMQALQQNLHRSKVQSLTDKMSSKGGGGKRTRRRGRSARGRKRTRSRPGRPRRTHRRRRQSRRRRATRARRRRPRRRWCARWACHCIPNEKAARRW